MFTTNVCIRRISEKTCANGLIMPDAHFEMRSGLQHSHNGPGSASMKHGDIESEKTCAVFV